MTPDTFIDLGDRRLRIRRLAPARTDGLEREAALAQTCELQMRPVLMTCIAACVGLLPAAFSTAIGSQVQRPLAIVVVGGMLLAPILFLTVLPAVIGVFSRRRVPATPAA